MIRPLAAASLLLSAFAAPASADIGRFRCTFDASPPVTRDIQVVTSTRVEITYPNGARIPYGAEGAGNVRRWQSNHVPAVRYEFDSSRRLAWARVPIASPAALAADEPFNPRIRRASIVPGVVPPAKLEAYYGYSAPCDVLP
jgi:hypothetical protein